MSENQSSNVNKFLIAGCILLFLLSGYLLYDKYSSKENIKNMEMELVESKELKAELETEYYSAMSELEKLRSENEEFNDMIEESQSTISEQKEKIDNLIAEGGSIQAARSEIENLKNQVQNHLAELQQLREENEQLKTTNIVLEQQKDTLRASLNEERYLKDSLAQVGQEYKVENKILSDVNEDLSLKVTKASSIEVTELDVRSYKIKDNGKLARRRKAKNVDVLEVCFETSINEIAEKGKERFLVRVINPMGETMAVESLGSGFFTERENESEMRYTQATQIAYDHKPSAGCIQWSPETSFVEGIYEIEVYNKGFLVGKTTSELR